MGSRVRGNADLSPLPTPDRLRVSNGQIFVVYYGPWQDDNSDVVGVYLEDLS